MAISVHRLLEALVYLLLPAWAISKIRVEAILCAQFIRHVERRMGTVLVCLLISERRKLHGENAEPSPQGGRVGVRSNPGVE